MDRLTSVRSGSFLYRNGPLFCLLTLLFPALLSAQNDSLHSLRIEAGTGYFNIFRQTSGRAETHLFAASHHAGVFYTNAGDSLSLFFRSDKEYGAVRQQNSQFSISSTNLSRTGELRYAGGSSAVSYSATVGYAIDARDEQMLYGGGMTIDPWERLIAVSASVKKNTVRNGTAVLFHDFFAPFDNTFPVVEIAAGISSQPVDAVRGEIGYVREISSKDSPRSGFGVRQEYAAERVAAKARFRLNGKSVAEVYGGHSSSHGEATLKKNDQSFGNVTDPWFGQNGAGFTFTTAISSLPLTFRYSFDEMFISGSGEIESWPFTTLAASVVANRLYFVVSGSVKCHSAGVSSRWTFFDIDATVELEYDKLLPELTLEHWEPEFLVFGMKNYVRNPFSISSAHLGKFHVTFRRGFSGYSFALSFDQYIPFTIEYRKFESVQPSPPPAPSAPQNVTTDGGRKIALWMAMEF